MKYCYTLLFLIFLAPISSFAQRDYKSGYVVMLNGDTIKGQVLYKKGEKNPKEAHLVKTGSAQPEEYATDQITGFGVYGVVSYQLFYVPISQDTPLDMRFTFGIDTTKIMGNVFLRRLITGNNISLFTYIDDIKQRFYISEKNGIPVELEYHEYARADNQLDPVTDARYKIRLQKLRILYQPDNKALRDQIQEAQYSIAYLAKIAVRLNNKAAGH
jgi:hypothetical protein